MAIVASPLKPGEVLAGRYRVERILGEGGMGVVLAAQHLVLGERVAIKMLLPDAVKLEGNLERFQREARAAARIQSEHVARVMDVGVTDDGTPYLVMEYVEGRDLSEELEARGPLPVEEAVNYVLQGAIGVAEAHALHIVHRDLKPSNLFVARLPNGRSLVKVLDFGIAKEAGAIENKELTTTFSALGSPAYMSPEQLRAAKNVDERTDVWAFGVVLYELLTGKIPFDGDSLTAITAAISVDPPASLRAVRPDAPAELEAVIMACLTKDREARISSLAVMASALAPFGGKSAGVLAGRIQTALGLSNPPPSPESRTATSGASPVTEPRPELQATRPAWTTSGGAKESANVKLIGIAVTFGLMLVAIAVLILRRSDSEPSAAAPSSALAEGSASAESAPRKADNGAALAAPPAAVPVASASDQRTESPPPVAAPPSARSNVVAPTPKSVPVRAARPQPKGPSGKIRKPLVTDL